MMGRKPSVTASPWRVLGAVVLLAALAGCGFRPMYGRSSVDPRVSAELAQVWVQPIDELNDKLPSITTTPATQQRIGQLTHNALLTSFNPRGEPEHPLWALTVALAVSESQVALQKDSTATRNNVTYTASYNLYQGEGRRPVATGQVVKQVSYDFLDQHYADVSAAADVERRAARNIAVDIRDRISAYFIRRAKALGTAQAVYGQP